MKTTQLQAAPGSSGPLVLGLQALWSHADGVAAVEDEQTSLGEWSQWSHMVPAEHTPQPLHSVTSHGSAT